MNRNEIRKVLATALAVIMVSVSFGMIASDNAQAAFIQPLNSIGLPLSFTPLDSAWNEAGTMAVVVGQDSSNGSSAYVYWPQNNTYVSVPNYVPGQTLYGVDCHGETAIVESNSTVPASSVDQSNEYTGNSNYRYVNSYPKWAQSFVPSVDNITGVEFFMYSNNTGAGDYYRIQLMNDSGIPGNISYADGWIYQSDIPQGISNADWVYCELSANTLTPGITYWLVITIYNSSWDQFWLADYSKNYTNGVAMEYSSGWFSVDYDWIFRTYYEGAAAQSNSSSTLGAAKDTTIYEDYQNNSNGAGEYIMAGMTMSRRRALIEFDIAGAIPAGSTVSSVSLNLYCSNVYNNNPVNITLHPMNQEWGEAGSDANGTEANGTSAWAGDATWYYASYSNVSMHITGGNYSGWSANAEVSWSNMWYTWDSSQMINDVQKWLDNPSQNHGWILKNNETLTYDMKWFSSKDNINSTNRPRLTVGYTTSGGGTEGNGTGSTVYRDIFWLCGGNVSAGVVYKIEPQTSLQMQGMGLTVSNPLYSISCDSSGNPLAAGASMSYLYYYDRDAGTWYNVGGTNLSNCNFRGVDFNPNDGRFYLAGYNGYLARPIVYYTDPAPLGNASKCYGFQSPELTMDCSLRSIAWNHYYNYGLAVGEEGLFLKIWPYNSNYTGMRYQSIASHFSNYHYDVSWDTDGWNEAGIVGTYSTSKLYWRYYDSNPQILEGYNGLAGVYYTCAFKPPSSSKWLLIPSGSGSIRINTEEKDQSGEITVNVNFPHIFTVDMWKQSNPARNSVLNTQIEADSTYTIFVEGNYTRDGLDRWNTDLTVYIQGWYDGNTIGFASNPPDMGWSSIMYRTWQFNISYFPATETAQMNYPLDPGMATPEFYIHSVWEDQALYGSDGNTHRFYVNVTFGKQTAIAPGDGSWNTGNPWDRTSLNDGQTWDLKVLFRDSVQHDAYNASYAEFGVQRYAALSVTGAPSGSIPPGGTDDLLVPSYITYSSNTPYQLNISIPNLHRNGDPMQPNPIPATSVSVNNTHVNAPLYSDIDVWTPFAGPDNAWCVWGIEPGLSIMPPGHGTVSAGPFYSDYTAAPGAFQPTPVYWRVSVPVGTAEGVYRGTITITLWS